MRGMEEDLDGAAFLGCPTMGSGVQEINAPAIPSALTHEKNRLFISKTSSVILPADLAGTPIHQFLDELNALEIHQPRAFLQPLERHARLPGT